LLVQADPHCWALMTAISFELNFEKVVRIFDYTLENLDSNFFWKLL